MRRSEDAFSAPSNASLDNWIVRRYLTTIMRFVRAKEAVSSL